MGDVMDREVMDRDVMDRWRREVRISNVTIGGVKPLNFGDVNDRKVQ